jgi:hypothetical protein
MGGVSEWKVENGVAICRRPPDLASCLIFGEEEWRNYSIECDAKMMEKLGTDHPAIGLDLRESNNNKDVVWCLAHEVWQSGLIWAWINDQSVKQSVRKPFNFKLDHWYHIKAVANEDNFEFYIDGELMASLSDDRFPTGRVDINACGCVAHFDNVVITGDDVPDNTGKAVVSSSGKLATTWGQLRSQ